MAEAKGMTQETGFVFEREIGIDAPPETVFEFFTDPEKMKQWMGSNAELDPQPGGVLRVQVLSEAIAKGEYVRVDPPRFVAFTWGWEGDGQVVAPGSSLVEVSLRPDGAGTVLTLRHTGLPTEEMAEQHKQGWTHYMDRLRAAASGRDLFPTG
ncbi:MAG TPA: SRPBCC family protein [Actinomycetota bacterium]|nr:SRPBCC family protein [Actinomycetota bacterium]